MKSDVTDNEISPPFRPVVGSAGSPTNSIVHQPASGLRPSRALINPFDPSHVTIKLTSNRRRWTHIFPKGPTGVLIQQHHYQAVPTMQPRGLENRTSAGDPTVLSSSPTEQNCSASSMSHSASQICFNERKQSLCFDVLREDGSHILLRGTVFLFVLFIKLTRFLHFFFND